MPKQSFSVAMCVPKTSVRCKTSDHPNLESFKSSRNVPRANTRKQVEERSQKLSDDRVTHSCVESVTNNLFSGAMLSLQSSLKCMQTFSESIRKLHASFAFDMLLCHIQSKLYNLYYYNVNIMPAYAPPLESNTGICRESIPMVCQSHS